MARLEIIVDALNLSLETYFPGGRLSGLATLVPSDAGIKPIARESVPIDDGYPISAYHRLLGTDSGVDEDAGTGSDPEVVETHQLVWVAYGHRHRVGGPSEVINRAKTVFNSQVQSAFRQSLQTRSVVIRAGQAESEALTVVNAQMPGLELSASEEYVAVAISYTVTLRYLRSCDELSCGIEAATDPIKTFCEEVEDCTRAQFLAEAAARNAGDASNLAAIGQESSTRESADSALATAIGNEAGIRAAADTNLQNQIDAFGVGVSQYRQTLTNSPGVVVPAATHGLSLVLDARCTDAANNPVGAYIIINPANQEVSVDFSPLTLTGFIIINGTPA